MANDRIIMDDEEKRLLSSPEVMPREIEVEGKKYYPKKFVSSKGFKSVVWEGVDKYGTKVAIKFVTYKDYINRSYLEEASKAAILRSYEEFAYFHGAEIIELQTPDRNKIKCVCFIEEWVEGKTLENFIQENKITPSFIINYIRKLCQVLNILKELNFRHDDLHFSNVMIASPKKGTLSEEYTVKVIDMGSLKPFDAPLSKEKDDHGWFTEHLIALYNSLLFDSHHRRKALNLNEKRFRKEIIPLINSMLEEDRQVALFEPSKIKTQFDHATTKSRYPSKEIGSKLVDPFDYISTEHIASDQLLIDLFAESCPWFKEVTSPNPILLTGPRGCGKSMLFRRLSLKAILYKSPEDIKKSEIVGFYIACNAELRNRFGYITSEAIINRFENEIIHYFNLLLSREIAYTLLFISQRKDRETLFGFGEIQEKELLDFFMDKLDIKKEERLFLQGVTRAEHLLEIIESEMNLCYEKFLKGYSLEFTTPKSFVATLTKFLKSKIVYFRDRTIVFLVDDYSIHRISESVQLLLNPIIWDRQSTHIFKISAEKYGAERVLESWNGSAPTADITREFREIDCGRYYIDLSDKGKTEELVKFAKELLEHRLTLAKYKGNSAILIGDSYYEERALAKHLIAQPKARDHYHGLKTIAEICSGDVSALLEVYYNIFKEGNITKNSKETVPKHVQHKAIVKVSRRFLELIKSYQPMGEEMHSIVINFGALCHKILRFGRDMAYKEKNGKTKFVRAETTRIEVDQISDEPREEWTPEQKKLIKELVRRAIFIEMEPGGGRATLGPTLRWQLRRIYCPAFKVGLGKTTAVIWKKMSDLKHLLTKPKDKCDLEFESRWKDPLKSGNSLFPEFKVEENNEGH